MNDIHLGKELLEELEMEARATRACLERIPAAAFDYQPHEKSMKMGYLALIVAEIPRWISCIIEDNEIDFATFSHPEVKDTEALVAYFDANMERARTALTKIMNEQMVELFYLKANGTVLSSEKKKESIVSTINHGVHHRGQLTVYMRLNDIPVPSIYGPSADDKTF